MADITAFPDIDVVNENNGPTWTFTAKGAIKHGQVVAFEATGVAQQVIASVKESGGYPRGVALIDAADGAKVTVCLDGSICRVANADDTTAIDAGDFVECNDNAVKGTVSAISLTGSGATCTNHFAVGQAIDIIAGGGTGLIVVSCHEVTQSNAS
jgi:hypothetical protein